MRYVRATDPFHRPLTIHPTAIGRYTARHATDDPALLDFDMLQTPHGRREAARHHAQGRPRVVRRQAGDAGDRRRGQLRAAARTILPTEWTRAMFWLCMINGAAGHTYGANGIWQCNRRGPAARPLAAPAATTATSPGTRR